MQSWLLYYITTFDMEKSAIVDVSDPSGSYEARHWKAPRARFD